MMTVREVAPKREHFINIRRRIEGHYRGWLSTFSIGPEATH